MWSGGQQVNSKPPAPSLPRGEELTPSLSRGGQVSGGAEPRSRICLRQRQCIVRSAGFSPHQKRWGAADGIREPCRTAPAPKIEKVSVRAEVGALFVVRASARIRSLRPRFSLKRSTASICPLIPLANR